MRTRTDGRPHVCLQKEEFTYRGSCQSCTMFVRIRIHEGGGSRQDRIISMAPPVDHSGDGTTSRADSGSSNTTTERTWQGTVVGVDMAVVGWLKEEPKEEASSERWWLLGGEGEGVT